jgi:hypothetical protein
LKPECPATNTSPLAGSSVSTSTVAPVVGAPSVSTSGVEKRTFPALSKLTTRGTELEPEGAVPPM